MLTVTPPRLEGLVHCWQQSPPRVRGLVWLGALAAALGCGGGQTRDASPGADAQVASFAVVGFTDLPSADARSHGLSGISWDASAGLLWAISDSTPQLVRLQPSADFTSWTLGDALAVTGAGTWDGEGVVRTATGFYCSDESAARVLPVDAAGAAGTALTLPAHFGHARSNKSLESLSQSLDGRYLFTMNEAALPEDGPVATTAQGSRLRLLRIDLTSGEQTERAYLTDVVPADGSGDLGVSDVAALSATRLVVLERSWVSGVGNSVRLYRVDLDLAPEVIDEAALTDATASLPKELLLDLATLPEDGFPPPPETQPTRVLANFEGLALGPTQSDGTRLLFLQSDDNDSATQAARVLVLAATGL